MKLSAKDLKVINWYAQEHKLKPQLSTPPTIYFKDEGGKEVKADLTMLTTLWNAWNEEDKKERARERKVIATRGMINRTMR